ncbi:3-phosphoshikimate 1-carboxyvinyltransferase [Chloroflexota bacterium]
MKASINKSEIKSVIKAPSSKSYTIRGLMCAALARGESEIADPLLADDTVAAERVLTGIGVHINKGQGIWKLSGRAFQSPQTDLFCGDSAATMRFMTALCAIVPGRCRLTAGPSLSKRPVEPLDVALRQLGVKCSSNNGFPPVTVEGGKLVGGTTEFPGDISSQFVSALLLIAPMADKEVKIRLTTPLESKPYVSMTLECLEKFGVKARYSEDLRAFTITPQCYQPARYQVEGDWSSASYFLALGALCGEVRVDNLNSRSLQGDRILIEFLRLMGASMDAGRNSVTVRKSRLKAIKADLTDCPDLLPTMAILCSLADGTSKLTGIRRARLKESDRVAAMKEGLKKTRIKVSTDDNSMTITGSKPANAIIESKGDHRIAMAFSLLGCAVGGIIIQEAECVSKTYPEFWNKLKIAGGEVTIYGK